MGTSFSPHPTSIASRYPATLHCVYLGLPLLLPHGSAHVFRSQPTGAVHRLGPRERSALGPNGRGSWDMDLDCVCDSHTARHALPASVLGASWLKLSVFT